MARFGVLAAIGASGCAYTASTCPTDTKLVVDRRPEGRAEYCSANEVKLAQLPGGSPGTSARTRVVSQPTAAPPLEQPGGLPGGIEGPFTSWYPNGAIASHGEYANFGARSVATGLWGFWYPNGQRWVIGRYQRGEPSGCFIMWDQSGHSTTGTVDGDLLGGEPCTPPDEDSFAELEPHARAKPIWGDVSLTTFIGPNRLGTQNPKQLDPDPSGTLAIELAARKRFGDWGAGVFTGLRLSGSSDGAAYRAGAFASYVLPEFDPRVASEITAGFGVDRIDRDAARTDVGAAAVAFWSPLPVLGAAVVLALSPSLSGVVELRGEGLPARDVTQDIVYHDGFGTQNTVHEAWTIGGISYGANVGLRLLLR